MTWFLCRVQLSDFSRTEHSAYDSKTSRKWALGNKHELRMEYRQDLSHFPDRQALVWDSISVPGSRLTSQLWNFVNLPSTDWSWIRLILIKHVCHMYWELEASLGCWLAVCVMRWMSFPSVLADKQVEAASQGELTCRYVFRNKGRWGTWGGAQCSVS